MQEPVCIWTIYGLFTLAAQLIGSVTARAADWDSRHLDPLPQARLHTPREPPGWAGYPWEDPRLGWVPLGGPKIGS